MSKETTNQDVNEYLARPPHWLVSHGILLIMLLIVAFTAASFFIKIPELQPVRVVLDLSAYEQGIGLKPPLKTVSLIATQEQAVKKGTPIINLFDFPPGGEMPAFPTADSLFTSAPGGSIKIQYSTLLSQAQGIFYYDSLRCAALVIPPNAQLTAKLRSDDAIKFLHQGSDDLVLIFENGVEVRARIANKQPLSGERTHWKFSFTTPRCLTQTEVMSRSLALRLQIEKRLFDSIIEKL